MLISKIISGGQTGVDRGAIEAALELGFPYGGLIPKGRLAEDGAVPDKFDRMEVAPRKDYLFRTEWNVTHSDAIWQNRSCLKKIWYTIPRSPGVCLERTARPERPFRTGLRRRGSNGSRGLTLRVSSARRRVSSKGSTVA